MNNAGKMIVGLIVFIILLGLIFVIARSNKAEVEPEVVIEPEVVATSTPLAAEFDGEYLVQSEESQITWEGRKPFVEKYVDSGTLVIKNGSFVVADGGVSGEIVLDMTTIAAVKTMVGKPGDLTNHLKSDDFFAVEKFPTATFNLEKLEVLNEGGAVYQANGSLTVKGITNPIAFPATITLSENTARVVATISLDRTLWDVRYGSGKFFEDLADSTIDDMFTVGLDVIAEREGDILIATSTDEIVESE